MKNEKIFMSYDNKSPLAVWPYNMLEYAEILPAKYKYGSQKEYTEVEDYYPLSDEQLDGLEKALSSLSEKEEKALRLYFSNDTITLNDVAREFGVARDTARQTIVRAIRKLRHPSRKRLILYGEKFAKLNVYATQLEDLKKKVEEYELFLMEHQETITKIYEEEMLNGTRNKIPEDISVNDLDLSVRSYNCLKRAQCATLHDVIRLYEKGSLMDVRNLGKRSYEEIVSILKEYGYVK